MLELPHVLVGMTIVSLIPDPAISLPLALISHFAFDLYPHWNPHIGTELKKFGHLSNKSFLIITLDVSLSVIALILISQNNLLIAAGGIFAVLPDLLGIPKFIFKKNIKILEPLIKFQKNHQWDVPVFWGLLSQLLVCLLCIWILFRI